MNIFKKLMHSEFLQFLITIFAYSLYIIIFTFCIAPSLFLIIKTVIPVIKNITFSFKGMDGYISYWYIIGQIIKAAFYSSLAFYLFPFTGILILGTLIRLLSFNIKPGRYKTNSSVFFRWLFFSGLYNFAILLVLPMVRMTYFINIFYKLVGCKMGKGVKFNSWTIPDAYLLELGDNVVIGAKTEITCHVFEGNYLLLKKITIGDNTLVGAHCYISPGTEIGKNCVIGLRSMVRKNVKIPDNTKIAGIAGLPLDEVYEIEKKAFLYKDKKVNERDETA